VTRALSHQAQRRPARAVSPVVRELFDLIGQRKMHISTVADAIGMTREALYFHKRDRTAPNILTVEEIAHELGYRVVLVPDAR
jgi:DNA-binding phage protein